MLKVAVLLAVIGIAGAAPAQERLKDCAAPDLVCRAALNQGRSLYVRDRSRYEQRLLMERFKWDKKARQQGELIAKRQTTVVVEPASAPDETGLIPVVTRVVADTNDKGEPKEKVDPNARTGLASGAFLDQIFFPLLPEKLQYLAFEEVSSEAAGERWFRFGPRSDNVYPKGEPLAVASGIVQLDEETGEVLTIRIDGLANLRSVDKHLEKISDFSAVVDYSQFGGRYRLPTSANGLGISDVSRFQGLFKFVFEEAKYAPVMKID